MTSAFTFLICIVSSDQHWIHELLLRFHLGVILSTIFWKRSCARFWWKSEVVIVTSGNSLYEKYWETQYLKYVKFSAVFVANSSTTIVTWSNCFSIIRELILDASVWSFRLACFIPPEIYTMIGELTEFIYWISESMRSLRIRSSEDPNTTITSCFVEVQNTILINRTKNKSDSDMLI